MKTVFSQIEEVIPKLHGWCSVPKAQCLAAAIIALRPKASMCIGVWGGRDTFAMALAHRAIRHGVVIGIDPWSADASIQGQSQPNVGFWKNQNMHETVYADYLKHKAALDLDQWIQTNRMISDYYEPGVSLGVLSLDGNHGLQALTDAKRFGPHIIPGGLVFADDLHWQENEGGGGVQPAVEYLKQTGFIELYPIDDGLVLQKVR